MKIDAPRVTGSISLVGARLDSLELDDYRETLAKNSPLVRLLAPRQDPQPTYVQFGWTGEGGGEGAGPGHALDRLRHDADARAAGDVALGQRRGRDI